MNIELLPSALSPVAKPAPAPAPLPAAPTIPLTPKPAPAPAAAKWTPLPPADPITPVELPDKIVKNQIRRVAFLYMARYAEERNHFSKTLNQAAQAISKKPLFLRSVLFQPVAADTSVAEVLAKLKELQAVAALALFEGMDEGRLKEYTEAMAGADIMFRVVAPTDVQKRSVAVDIIVDMMLLSHEA